MLLQFLKKHVVVKGCKCVYVRSRLLESVIVFHAAEAYCNLNLPKAKYSISRLSMMQKENVISQINRNNFVACENTKSTL
jgi:hypothetical protein